MLKFRPLLIFTLLIFTVHTGLCANTAISMSFLDILFNRGLSNITNYISGHTLPLLKISSKSVLNF